jgi:ketopantoate reductase
VGAGRRYAQEVLDVGRAHGVELEIDDMRRLWFRRGRSRGVPAPTNELVTSLVLAKQTARLA